MSSVLNHSMPPPRSFHVMTKPIGPLCNLNCRYCFYLEKEKLFPDGENYRMDDEVLETYIREYIQSQNTPEIQFAWQGGEPTLLGLDFFRKAAALQRHYAAGRPVSNAFQTNGTQLDDEWCEFFAREKFLVGLSLDGPKHIHNRYRVDKDGAGSFDQVMTGMQLLKKRRVEFNTLTCVTRQSPAEAVEIYTFLKAQGVQFMQFIPIVERVDGLNGTAVMPWAVSSEGFGDFLAAVFDEWATTDVGRIFVNIFDVMLAAWSGMEPGLCTFSRRCGQAVAMEHDGGIYSCDHYVYPSYFLGNIMEKPLEEIIFSPAQVKFGNDKWDALPKYCRECGFLFACNGECPKHRFIKTPDGEPGLNYLCAGYKKFFRHINPAMREMAALVRSGHPASDIMQKTSGPITRRAGRNDLCPCGSGKKLKKCCGK